MKLKVKYNTGVKGQNGRGMMGNMGARVEAMVPCLICH